MLTKQEAEKFVEAWVEEHKPAAIAEMMRATEDPETENALVTVIVEGLVATMNLALHGAIALVVENNRRWEARLREAGIVLKDPATGEGDH